MYIVTNESNKDYFIRKSIRENDYIVDWSQHSEMKIERKISLLHWTGFQYI